jgi:hypothetical protein
MMNAPLKNDETDKQAPMAESVGAKLFLQISARPAFYPLRNFPTFAGFISYGAHVDFRAYL